jgi:hypothetical protein
MRERGPVVQFLVLPKKTITTENVPLENPTQVSQTFGLEFLQAMPSPSFLPQIITSMILEEDATAVLKQLKRLLATSPSIVGGIPQGTGIQDPEGKIKALEKRAEMPSWKALITSLSDIQSFAEYIAFQKMVPVEESPLTSVRVICNFTHISSNSSDGSHRKSSPACAHPYYYHTARGG